MSKLISGNNKFSSFPFQNYNKSRIHSYRGAKDIEITLDGQLIFKGEVTRACGGIIGGSDSFAEVSHTDAEVVKVVPPSGEILH